MFFSREKKLTKAQRRNLRRGRRREELRKQKQKELQKQQELQKKQKRRPIKQTFVLSKAALFTNLKTKQYCYSMCPPYIKNDVLKRRLQPVILFEGIIWKPPRMLSENEINISSFTEEISEKEMQQKYEWNKEYRHVNVASIKRMDIKTWRRYIYDTGGGSYYEQFQKLDN